MVRRRTSRLLIGVLGLTACGNRLSTAEVKRAAIDRARQEQHLSPSAQLKARAWVGKDYHGQTAVCGIVADMNGKSPAQRFAATLRPFRWLIFQDAHGAVYDSRPQKFADWGLLCERAK